MRYEEDYFENLTERENWEETKQWLLLEEIEDLKELYNSKVFRPFSLLIIDRIQKNEIFEAKMMLDVADNITILMHSVGHPGLDFDAANKEHVEQLHGVSKRMWAKE